MAAKEKKKGKSGAKKLKVSIAHQRDGKWTDVEVAPGTTVADALIKAGQKVDADKDPAQLGWRLNGAPVKNWTTPINEKATLVGLVKGEAGSR